MRETAVFQVICSSALSNLNPCWNVRLLFLFFSISAMDNRLFLMSTYRNGTDGIFVSSCFACYAPFRRGINSDTYLETEETCFFPGSSWIWQRAGLVETACCGKQMKGVRKSLERCRNLQVEENLSCWEETGSRQEIFRGAGEGAQGTGHDLLWLSHWAGWK